MAYETQVQDPQQPTPYINKVYSALKDNLVGFDKTPEQFATSMKDSAYAAKAYSALKDNLTGFNKSQDDFYKEVGVPKKPTPSGGLNTSVQLQNGLANFQGSPQNIVNSPVTAAGMPEVLQHQNQQAQQEQDAKQRVSDNLKSIQGALDPEHRAAFQQATNSIKQPETVVDDKAALDHYNYMQTPIGKTLGALQYMGSKATKGALQVAKGASYLYSKANPTTAPITDAVTDDAFKKADDNTNFGLTKGDQQRMADNPVTSNLGGLAEFLPSAAAAGSTGGATFYLQGLGQGKESMDGIEKSGVKINPNVKDAFILGTGLVNGVLMGDLGAGMFKTLPAGLRGDITASITADAIKDAAGKEITGDGFKDLLNKGAKSFEDKVMKGGISALEGYKHAATNLGALTTANFALKKGVDMANDQPVFNETAGDLASQLNDVATKQAPAFALPSVIGAATKLTPYSDYKNSVVESLMHDSSPENIARTKEDIANHGMQQGWTPQEIQDTQSHVDKIGEVARSLPKNIPEHKLVDAVDLVTNRKQLEQELAKEQEGRKQLDPAVQGIISPNEQLLTDKIDQANDKLKAMATGKRVYYGEEKYKDTGEETGKFYKSLDGKREEITQSRYELEGIERDARNKAEVKANEIIPENEQAKSNTEVPAEQPADETVGVPKVADQNDETTKNSPITPKADESNDGKVGIDKEKSTEESGKSGSKENDNHNGEEKRLAEEGNVKKSGEAKVEPVSKRNRVSDAPTLKELSHNLPEEGKGGISIEPAFKKDNKGNFTEEPLDNGTKQIVSRDKDGKVNGVLEVSYNGKDGEAKEPQSVKVVVDENSRRQGIATALFKHADDSGIDLSKVRGKETTDAGQALLEGSAKKQGAVRQKAIDAIAHGIIGNGERQAGDTAARFDLGMDTRDQKKAIADVTKGNYETAPAKRMIAKIAEFEAKGEYPIIEGDGGNAKRSRFATPEDIQQHIDDAKQFKLAKEQDAELNNKQLPQDLTHEDFENYYNHRGEEFARAGEPGDGRATTVPTEDAQQPKNDKNTSGTSDTGSKAAQAVEAKRQSLSDSEAARKKELSKKFLSRLNDITNIPTLLADKEFREYAGLVFKEAAGDFKAFSKELIDNVGEKIKEHLPQLFKDLGGEPPKEVVPEESGLNKASVAENRKVIGLKDVNKPEVLDGDQEYRKAAEKVRNGSLSPYDIAEHIIRTRETPTIEEFNALLYQNRVIDNQYEEAIGKVEEAEKNGNAADKEDARNQLLVLEKNKDLLHNAARNVSYNWGFMGRMLQEAVKKDYTLSNLRSLFRSKADGEIPADIEAKLTQYVKERDEAVKKLQDYQSKEAERAAQIKVDRERRANNRKVTTEKLDKAIEDTFASISKKLKAQRATLSMNPIPVEMLPDIGKLVSYYSQKGIIKAADIADNIYSRLKDDIDGLTKKDVIDAMAGNGYQKETKSLDELQKQKADIKLQAKLISRLEDLESGKVQPSLLKSKRSISEEVQSLRERIKKAAIDAGIPLDNLKKNLQTKLDELEKTIKGIQSGEIEAPKKTPSYKVEPDQEALRLKAKVRRAEKLIDELGANLDQRREKNVNKFLDGYTKLHRFFILSRIGTLAKLRSAAMGRQLTSPIEEVLGAINKELPGFRKIAERSPRFSKGLKISAEIKAMSQHYTKATLADNNQVLKEGHGELDYLFDPKAQKETEMSGFPGRLHAWLKNSTKRAEFQRSFEHIMQWEKTNNPDLDVNDPAVQERVGKEAYNEARRSIFMNDNMAVDLYNNVLNFAERNWGTTGKTIATAFRALMPIVKIPTNFALEATDYATLGARAIPTVLKAVFKGAESLSPKEADFVMRMMRKGELGGAMMAIAYFNPKHFGGYNVPGQKRDKDDLHQGDMMIGDFKVPHLLQHIPLISAMQAAATLRRTRDFNIEKGKEGGTYKGMINGFMGLMENVPFLSAPSELSEALKSDNGFNSYVGSMVKNQVEPGIMQEAAEQTDTKDGSFATINPDNAQKRYPDTKDGLGKSITDNLKMGVPGLREEVSGQKASEVDKAIKKIKLPNGPEFELNDAQVKDREKVNADYIKQNGDRLKASFERKASRDKELLKKIHDRAKVWKEHDVPLDEKKKFKQELIDAYVEHHIKLIANKHSMPYIYRKYKNDLKPVEE